MLRFLVSLLGPFPPFDARESAMTVNDVCLAFESAQKVQADATAAAEAYVKAKGVADDNAAKAAASFANVIHQKGVTISPSGTKAYPSKDGMKLYLTDDATTVTVLALPSMDDAIPDPVSPDVAAGQTT